jgi:hypothetical protein
MTAVNSANAAWNSLAEAYTKNWLQLIRAPIDIKNKNSYILFQKRKLNVDESDEMTSFLMSSFLEWTENVFGLHLHSIEYCLMQQQQRNKSSNNDTDQLAILYFNKTFVDWFQIETNAKGNEPEIKDEHVRKAFDLTMANMSLLTSFNKVYILAFNCLFGRLSFGF